MTPFRIRARLARRLAFLVPRLIRARYGLWRQRRAHRAEMRRRERLIGMVGRPRDGPR